MKTVLWWGRFDPQYSRNRILRHLLAGHGWIIRDFHPAISALGDLELMLRRTARPDLVWVPCFRQRDMAAASRWAARRRIPLVFDPLISAYDKQVDERGKLSASSRKARNLLAWERDLFCRATRVLADTSLHADYYVETLGVERQRLSVVYVGAEESLFQPRQGVAPGSHETPEVLFYGSFIPLQGPEIIVEAARQYNGPPVRWTLIGRGPLHDACVAEARGLDNVSFEDWVPYEVLPTRIGQADILLGIFGDTPKAARVIPNKVFQSLACGKVVITRRSAAYPQELLADEDTGLVLIDDWNAGSLAKMVAQLAGAPDRAAALGVAAAATSQKYFSEAALWRQLSAMLDEMSL